MLMVGSTMKEPKNDEDHGENEVVIIKNGAEAVKPAEMIESNQVHNTYNTFTKCICMHTRSCCRQRLVEHKALLIGNSI
jgi:hypothetical protein